jgi:hypothetical protein
MVTQELALHLPAEGPLLNSVKYFAFVIKYLRV